MNRTVPGLPFSRKRTCSTYWAASSLVTPQNHEFLYSRVLQHRRSLLEQALFLWLHWINSQQWKWNATVFQLSWLLCFYGKQQLHAMNLKSTNCWKLGPIINRQLVFFVFVFVCLFVIFLWTVLAGFSRTSRLYEWMNFHTLPFCITCFKNLTVMHIYANLAQSSVTLSFVLFSDKYFFNLHLLTLLLPFLSD